MEQLIRTAGELGLPFGRREKTFNSRLAQELGKFAEQQQKGDAFHNAAFRAYFADGLNIGLQSTLIEIGASVGLPGKKVQEILEQRLYKDAVDGDWNRSYQKGVNAVPTFLMNQTTLVGAQSYEKLVQFVEAQGVAKRF